MSTLNEQQVTDLEAELRREVGPLAGWGRQGCGGPRRVHLWCFEVKHLTWEPLDKQHL